MTGNVETDSARLIAELGTRIGSLGVEVADIAGNLEDVTTRISHQAAQCEELEQSAQTMAAGNREIDRAAREGVSVQQIGRVAMLATLGDLDHSFHA